MDVCETLVDYIESWQICLSSVVHCYILSLIAWWDCLVGGWGRGGIPSVYTDNMYNVGTDKQLCFHQYHIYCGCVCISYHNLP